MTKHGINLSKIYGLNILDVLDKELEKNKGDEEKAALWKAKITRMVGKRLPDCNIHRSTVGRHMEDFVRDGYVKEVLIPYSKNKVADKGYVITELGRKFLDARDGWVNATFARVSIEDFIYERYGMDTSDPDQKEPEILELFHHWSSWLGIEEGVIKEAIDKREGLRDLKETVLLLNVWHYLRDAIEHGRQPDGPSKRNEVLKHLAMRDPRVMDMVCNTYSLPLEDIADIYEYWEEPSPFLVPVDQHMAIKVMVDEEDGLTVKEVRDRLKEKGIIFYPKNTLEECVAEGYFMEKIEEDGEERYRLTEGGRKFVGG